MTGVEADCHDLLRLDRNRIVAVGRGWTTAENLDITVADDAATAYKVLPASWSAGGRESRGETILTPRPPDEARTLRIEFGSFGYVDWMAGSVAIAATGEGGGEGLVATRGSLGSQRDSSTLHS